jgi:uncharacterized protein YeaO (DUF488 family)
MGLRTKRWNEMPDDDDGLRVLVCRYRPRGLPKGRETWDEWWPQLAPSRELHAARYGKGGRAALSYDEYRPRYLAEMKQQTESIQALADRVAAGETVTLLCSSACTEAEQCHRTLLARLIEERISG